MKIFCLIFLAAFHLFSEVAFSTQMVIPDFEKQVSDSDLIVHGLVEKVESYSDDGRIFTKALITPIEIIKCRNCGKAGKITVVVPGGEEGRFVQIAVGAPRFKSGEEVILFLEKRGGNFVVNSLSFGKWTVIAGEGVKRVVRHSDGIKFFEKTDSSLEPLSVPDIETYEFEEFVNKIKNKSIKLDND